MAIKLFAPYVSKQSILNVNRVLRSGYLAEGQEVRLFEQEFEHEFDVENAVALNSGTSALELAYELAGLGKGDEVIAPVLTCTATNIPLVRRGCRIVFADTSEDLNVDIEDVKRKITKKTKAIVFVHFGGNNRGLTDLLTICRKRGIALIEDAAQAVGSEHWGEGDFTAVSLQAIKTLTSGDGGFLVCKRKKDYQTAKKLRWFGYDREQKHKKGDIDLKLAGYKYHMNNISAAIGRGNLRDINLLLEHRETLADIYARYGIECHAWLAVARGNYKKHKPIFEKAGIEIGQHHYRNDKYTLFGGRKKLANMDRIENDYYFVPYHHYVTPKQAHTIGKIYAGLRKS